MKRYSSNLQKCIRTICLVATFVLVVCASFVLFARAEGNVAIPRVSDSADPVVVITGNVETGAQAGYSSLEAAMNAIGDGIDDYTIVFTQDYTMKPISDRDATVSKGTHASSLTITSTCYKGTSTTATVSTVQSAGVTYASDLTFNADTLIHDFSIRTSGGPTVHMMGNGHKFTVGDNVTTVGKVQLYGGGDADITGDTALTVNSGTYSFVMAGGRNGAVNGTANADIGGTTKIDKLYAGSQSVVLGSDFTGNITISGEAAVSNVYGSYKANGIPVGATVNVILDDTATVINLTPTSNNKGAANVIVNGDCSATGTTTVTSLEITDNATFSTGTGTANGALTVNGNMKLGSNASYIHAGNNPTQTVNGNLIVSGSDASLGIFKRNEASATLPLTVGGSYQGSDKLNLTIYNDVVAADDDILLTFTTPANANADNYNDYYCEAIKTKFGAVKSTVTPANIVYQTIYVLPDYYVPDATIADLYSFTAVGNATPTDGGSHIEYRKLQDNKWYASDASGAIIGSPLDIELDRPQPDMEYPVDYNISQATMVRIDEMGFYHITAAVGTNAHGDSRSGINTASGNSANYYNIDDKGDTNASWAILKQTNETCSIKRAFLIMTTTLDAGADADAILNTPMKLVAENNDVMLSNGYLPEGFSVAVSGSAGGDLTANTPTLLFDRAPNRGDLGEAMIVTEVTDFVKEHGYGKYYGVDIPSDGIDVDAVIGWRLVVIEEDSDPSMKYIRRVSVQMGSISNGRSTVDNPTIIDLNLNGLTTPGSVVGAYSGQVLMIGSDNLMYGKGHLGSNLHNTFYPDPENNPLTSVKIGSNDPNTDGIDRPEYYWSQGHVDIDGVNLPEDQMSHITDDANKYVGIDMQLLNVTNTQNSSWQNDGDGGGGHNLYLTDYSPSIRLSTVCDSTGIGYIDTLALLTDIETPEFTTQITHTDDGTPPLEGVDIVTSKTVRVNAVATNVTPNASSVLGSINTKVVIDVDEKLSDIRDITAVFTSGGYQTPITGVYDPLTRTIEFDFGQDFLAPDGNTYQKFNIGGDFINISFNATTDSTPTIDDDSVNYTNKISVYGTDIYKKAHPAGFVHLTENACYATDSDDFDTYKNTVIIGKTVSGNAGDKMKLFSFNLRGQYKAQDGSYQDLPAGYTLEYMSADSEEVNTMTVNASGMIVFQLKDGQSIILENAPFDRFSVSEVGAADYLTSWTWESNSVDVSEVSSPDTGYLEIDKTGDHVLQYTNDKTVVIKPLDPTVIGEDIPYTGDSSPLQLMLAFLSGSALLAAGLIIMERKAQRNSR